MMNGQQPPPMPQNPTMQVPPPKQKKGWTWVWLMVIAIVITANSALALIGGIPTRRANQKWEYAGEFASDSELSTKFSEAGDKYWEVVHCRRARNGSTWGYECLFKRPKQ